MMSTPNEECSGLECDVRDEPSTTPKKIFFGSKRYFFTQERKKEKLKNLTKVKSQKQNLNKKLKNVI